MLIEDAQRDMRDAYLSGAPGMLVSAVIWLVAGLVALHASNRSGVFALFAGGVLIFPLSVLACRMAGRSGRHALGNPLGGSALEGTGWLIFSFPTAFAAYVASASWFFPSMLLVIGGRYLTFKTLYGIRLYWACGLALALAAWLLAAAGSPPHVSAFVGAAVEACFALAILSGVRRRHLPRPGTTAP
jgi:hypothetical protein